MTAPPLRLFIIYAREDELYRHEIAKHLRLMERTGMVSVWSAHELLAGEAWELAIKDNLKRADIILLLVSSDYFDSHYIHEVEIKEALLRHESGEARVIPIIVRPCDWEIDPVLSRMQVLPSDAIAVSDARHWLSREAAWLDVVKGIRHLIEQAELEKAKAERERLESIERERLAAAEAKRKEQEKIKRKQLAIAKVEREKLEKIERERSATIEAERKERERIEQQQLVDTKAERKSRKKTYLELIGLLMSIKHKKKN